MKIFISHPYANNISGNKLRNLELLYTLKEQYPEHLFLWPLLLFDYLTEDSKRAEVMEVCRLMILHIADELWVYGDTDGCRQEIEFAEKARIKIKRK